MKYWVYKESRILGPFDKESVSSLGGVDSGTLVCAGDPAGGSWVPAGELEGLSGIAAVGAGGLLDDLPSSVSLLDQLQIESSGLLNENEFPDSLSDELFQDGAFKKDFQDILSDRISTDEASARRARDKIIELTTQLESMYRHVSVLEAGQTDLSRRLAEKEQELRSRPTAEAAEAAAAKTFLSPAAPPIPGGAPPVAAVQGTALPPTEWPVAPAAGAEGFPSFAGAASAPSDALPAASVSPVAPDGPLVPPAPALPDMPSFAAAAVAPLEPPQAPAPEAAPAPKPLSFGKPKSFKIVPTIKSFKVLGAAEAVPAASANPVPEFTIEPIAETPAAPPPVEAPSIPTAVAAPAPVVLTPVPPPPVVLAPAVPVPAAFQTTEPSQVMNPFTLPAPLTPAVPPPNTLNRSLPVPDLTSGDLSGSVDAAAQGAPPATMARSGGDDGASAPASVVAAARFAKPEPAPPTGEIKKPGRNNKTFLIAGGVLVTLLMILGVIFMRQPKDDLKQMTTLDDGKAPIGVPADDAAAPPPIVKPKIAQPAPAAPPAPPPGPSAEHLAAIGLVKDFPLDGDRGTVGRWLQYSYTANPGAGTEEWNASTTGNDTVLVEYRMVPGSSGGRGALYLFEVDSNGIVAGKNIEARQMLAGGPPPDAPKAKKKPAKKASSRRRAVRETPKEVPLLPLPDSGELRPPAEDDGTFGSDTINSGI